MNHNSQQHQGAQPTFPLVGLAMDFLRADESAEERLTFGAHGKEALSLGVEALFQSGQPAAPALTELLGLAWVLDNQERCPTAAALIRAAVQNDQRALRALGISSSDAALLKRGAARLTGVASSDRAPVFGSAAPAGAKKASSLIDPMTLERSRIGAKAEPNKAPGARPKAGVPSSDPQKPGKARRTFGVN